MVPANSYKHIKAHTKMKEVINTCVYAFAPARVRVCACVCVCVRMCVIAGLL